MTLRGKDTMSKKQRNDDRTYPASWAKRPRTMPSWEAMVAGVAAYDKAVAELGTSSAQERQEEATSGGSEGVAAA
jgi:hypothetical protein